MFLAVCVLVVCFIGWVNDMTVLVVETQIWCLHSLLQALSALGVISQMEMINSHTFVVFSPEEQLMGKIPSQFFFSSLFFPFLSFRLKAVAQNFKDFGYLLTIFETKLGFLAGPCCSVWFSSSFRSDKELRLLCRGLPKSWIFWSCGLWGIVWRSTQGSRHLNMFAPYP